MQFFITGAGRGIGLELTKQALTSGHSVVAGVRTPATAMDLAAVAVKFPDKLITVELDVSSTESVNRVAKTIGQEMMIDVLINNAGVYLDSRGGALGDLSLEVLQSTLDTNTIGPVRVTKSLFGNLLRSKAARVVNISSLMGSVADNKGGGAYAYRLSKCALNMFTKNLALERPDWSVISVHPGWVQTDMGGSGASVTIAQSAAGILKLITDLSPAKSGKFFDFKGPELPW